MIVDHEKLNKYVDDLHNATCPLCHNNEWSISDVIFYASEFNQKDGGLVLGGPTRYMPFITITCAKCGNTHVINALIAGLYDSKENLVQKENQ